jgi:hypothetical protein
LILAVKTTILTVFWCVAGARGKKPFLFLEERLVDPTFGALIGRFSALHDIKVSSAAAGSA